MFGSCKKAVVLVLCFSMAVLFNRAHVSAEPANEEVLKRMEQMESRIKELEGRLAVYENKEKVAERKLSQVEEKVSGFEGKFEEATSRGIGALAEGIELGAGATFVYQFTNNANGDDLSQNSEDAGDVSYSVDLELSKEFGDYGKALVLFEAGQGAGVEDELKVLSNVNFDATGGDSNLGVVEGWYEHYIGPVTLRFGKLDPTYLIDNNDYANDEASQFLGRIFRNNPVVAFADNGAGLRVAVSPYDFIDVESIVMDGDGDWEDMFEDTFYAGQINIKPNLFDRPGNYRFYGWGSNREHTTWDDTAQTKKGTYGFGLSFDQEIADGLGIFARYGWQNPKVFLNGEDISLEQSYSAGMQVAGSAWKRDDDVLGLAFGGVIPSDDYKKSDSALKAGTEHHLEAYYNYKVNDHLSISPDIQVIWGPYGGDAANGDKTIVVGGIRSQGGIPRNSLPGIPLKSTAVGPRLLPSCEPRPLQV